MNKRAKDWLESFLYAFVALFLLYFLCWPLQVSGDSMADTMHSGDRIVVSRLLSLLDAPQRGDIIVCSFKVDGKKSTVVKRVVALPGDHVQIKNGALFLNESECIEPYLGNTTTIGQTDLFLAEDEYFVLGDNRRVSFDSRAYGPVLRKHIIAKVMARWYPFTDLILF